VKIVFSFTRFLPGQRSELSLALACLTVAPTCAELR
jgi:hypothetical protein